MQRWIPAILLIVLLSVFRVLGSTFPTELPNFQPLPALLLCSLIFLKGAQRWLIPGAVWLLTDPLTSLLHQRPVFGWHHLAILVGVIATVGIAMLVRRKATILPVLTAAIGSAIAFYFLTNLISFATDPIYPKTLTGFIQAQWSGPVGYGPTWVFLRNLVMANTAFTALFMATRLALPAAATAPSQITAR